MASKVMPLVVIVGETGSGKSALAVALAKKFNGEIICADSRTIYREMDIGTAKPTAKEQQSTKHHLIDIVGPTQTYNAAQFKIDANKAINEISERHKLPIMVGGSGLYIDSVIFDYQFSAKNRERDPQNPRHLMARPDSVDTVTNLQQLRPNTLIIGLKLEKEVLEQRIKSRIEYMVEHGLVEEVKTLGEKYGWSSAPLNGIGYKSFGQYIRGECSFEEAKARATVEHLQLAKRQRTWFKRNKYIHLVSNLGDAVALVKTFLNQSE